MTARHIYSADGRQLTLDSTEWEPPETRAVLGVRDMWLGHGHVIFRQLLNADLLAFATDAQIFGHPAIKESAEDLVGAKAMAFDSERNPRTGVFSQQRLPSWLAQRGCRVIVPLTALTLKHSTFELIGGSHKLFAPVAAERLTPRDRYIDETLTSLAEEHHFHVSALAPLEPGDVVFVHPQTFLRRSNPTPDALVAYAACAEFHETELPEEAT